MTPPTPPPYRKKLIEVALPLEAINKESAREKSIRHGHPSTLHLWWARRPLAACRAVIFSSLVDDPSSWPELFPTEEEQEKERQRIFRIIEELVIWENSNNPGVLLKAHTEIARSLARGRNEPLPEGTEAIRAYIAEHAPPVYDPFCGGGSIPLEAQRLGLKAYGSDLNPIAVLITKALIEIPPKFAGMPPVNPESRKNTKINGGWEGAKGIAEDVRYYGQWMRDEAEKRIGHLYPKVKITEEMAKDRPDLVPYVGQELTVIAWLWARTVKSPNPAVRGADTPLISTYWLSKKRGKEVWIEPIINKEQNIIQIKIKNGLPGPKVRDIVENGTKIGRGASFKCLFSDEPISKDYIHGEFLSKRNGRMLLALVVDGGRNRIFLPPLKNQIEMERLASPKWQPEEEMNEKSPNLVSGRGYGIKFWNELFSSRQLLALTTLYDLIKDARNKIISDGFKIDNNSQNQLCDGANLEDYADAVAIYITFILSKVLDRNSQLTRWMPQRDSIYNTFARHALPMVWDYVEVNPIGRQTGGLLESMKWTVESISNMHLNNIYPGKVEQKNALDIKNSESFIFSTDPPYYDNIGYADLSDYFYIWMRRSLQQIYPSLFSTVLTPKKSELVAAAYRHNNNFSQAKDFFENGLIQTFTAIKTIQNEIYPTTVFYAFKQVEKQIEPEISGSSISSTGWETMLKGLILSGFMIIGTWPMQTERTGRSIELGTNALASSIVLVCRPRPDDAKTVTRREFLSALKKELPQALHNLQQGLIAPVDLAQAAIGPGMAVFTRYAKVMESDGSAMTVRTALGIINQILDEVLAEQEGEFDTDTRWAVAWFEQHGMEEGPYGEAETLAVAKNISVQGIVDAGILTARGGKAKLIPRAEYPDDWDPATDTRLPVWEATQHLIRTLENQGESGAADLLNKLGGTVGDQTRDLAYRLYAICERKKWSAEAMAYNGLIISWPEISKLAQGALPGTTGQQQLS